MNILTVRVATGATGTKGSAKMLLMLEVKFVKRIWTALEQEQKNAIVIRDASRPVSAARVIMIAYYYDSKNLRSRIVSDDT